MSENLYVFTLVLIAATCVLIFGVKAWATFQSARTREAREEAYRDLATKCAAAQTEVAAQLAGLQSEATHASARLAAIEGLLKSVE